MDIQKNKVLELQLIQILQRSFWLSPAERNTTPLETGSYPLSTMYIDVRQQEIAILTWSLKNRGQWLTMCWISTSMRVTCSPSVSMGNWMTGIGSKELSPSCFTF
ncbi:hypothetical protein AOXY_G3757 [Acipenser oxyrinchus oxyrinchus]|uniref:Uncharacterized protein n=1 Tax=Acipenser oxyrinchus oxyrinchus TaxID=40147 RepID=A0AAD8GGA0_ACIOX|nr:hypothetical protein AOXY_G3757 [Acipenser oxyrinchus oxyrinchus]